MSLPGRPKGEFRSAQHEGSPVKAPAGVGTDAAPVEEINASEESERSP